MHLFTYQTGWLSLSFLPVVSAQCWPNRSNLGFRVLHMNGWTHGLQEQYVKETQILVKHQTEDKWAFVGNYFSLFPKRRTYLPSCRNVYYPLYTYVVTDVCNTHISYSICCVMDPQPGLRRKHNPLTRANQTVEPSLLPLPFPCVETFVSISSQSARFRGLRREGQEEGRERQLGHNNNGNENNRCPGK